MCLSKKKGVSNIKLEWDKPFKHFTKGLMEVVSLPPRVILVRARQGGLPGPSPPLDLWLRQQNVVQIVRSIVHVPLAVARV